MVTTSHERLNPPGRVTVFTPDRLPPFLQLQPTPDPVLHCLHLGHLPSVAAALHSWPSLAQFLGRTHLVPCSRTQMRVSFFSKPPRSGEGRPGIPTPAGTMGPRRKAKFLKKNWRLNLGLARIFDILDLEPIETILKGANQIDLLTGARCQCQWHPTLYLAYFCLLYTSDAADE